ncbi:unnamed protein product, partial [marine sediment metagenome]
FILFGGVSFLLWLLSVSIFYLIGGAILIFAGIGLMRGVTAPMFIWILGAVLVIMPSVFKTINNLSLAAILP